MVSLKHFSLSHEHPELFRVCQWGDVKTVTKIFLCYRTSLAIAYTSIYLYIWTLDSTYSSHWLIYLTNQSMLMLGPPASRHVPHHYCLHEAEGWPGAKDGFIRDDKLASCNSHQQHLSPRFNLLLDISVSIGSQNDFRKYIFTFVQHNLVRYEQHEDYQKF